MIVLKPVSKERIWGTPRLHQYSGDSHIDRIGSVYSVSGIEALSNEILAGDEHRTLYEAVKAAPEKFGITPGVDYPIIISFTSADENLSIQVHPTDEYAITHENALYGKSESWYFIEPPSEGWIYADSLIEDKREIKRSILNGDYESVVGKIIVSKDDVVYIPSGTLHALTRGSLVYEIQQSTDITYRFFDYNRLDNDGKLRDLHLDDAIETLNTENRVKSSAFPKDTLVSEQPYTMVRKTLENVYHNTTDVAVAITVSKGSMCVDGHSILAGMSILVLPDEAISISQAAEEVVIATPKLYFK